MTDYPPSYVSVTKSDELAPIINRLTSEITDIHHIYNKEINDLKKHVEHQIRLINQRRINHVAKFTTKVVNNIPVVPEASDVPVSWNINIPYLMHYILGFLTKKILQ